MNEIKVNHVYDFTNSAEKLTVREKEVPNVKRIDWSKIKAAITRFLSHRLVRKNGIAAAIVLFVMLYGIGVSTVTEHRVAKRLTAELSEQYAAEFDARMETYISQQEAIERAVGDGSMQAQIEREAEAIAQVVDDEEEAVIFRMFADVVRKQPEVKDTSGKMKGKSHVCKFFKNNRKGWRCSDRN